VTAILRISERDNVATALEALEPGREVTAGDLVVVVRERIPAGHKIALSTIEAGAQVVKYGSPIGVACRRIGAGTHVHVHNIVSTRGRGDLVEQQRPGPAVARLAEPDGETPGHTDDAARRDEAGSAAS
jgi:altronate dehydratase small subunit